MSMELDDLDLPIRGTAAIGRLINETERRATDLCVSGAIPAYKLNGSWYLRPRRYFEHIATLEAEALAKKAGK